MGRDKAGHAEATHVLYYDGVCGLCSRLVQFVLRHDRRRRFRYAPLQGPSARDALGARGYDPGALDTIHVLTADGHVLVKSRAVFFVLTALGGFWGLLGWLRVLPRFLTDTGYDAVAAVRYKIWGRSDSCAVPPPESRELFIE